MSKQWRLTRIVMAAVAAAVLVPAAAWAGKKVVDGDQSLQLKVSLKPAQAGAKGGVLTFQDQYENPKQPSQQPPYNTKTTTVRLPKGMVVHPHSAPQCRESVVLKAATGGGVCPADSKVGTGTVVVNYRPFSPSLITGKITQFNGVDDASNTGFPKGSPVVILYIKTSVGVDTTDFFHLVKRDGTEMLTGTASRPPKQGIQPGDLTIEKLRLRLSRSSSKKPYITNPPTCHGSWPFSMTITNYFGQPSVTAHDAVRCTR